MRRVQIAAVAALIFSVAASVPAAHLKMRPTKMRPTKMRPTKMRPTETRPTEMRPTAENEAWRDPSPHRVQFIDVEPGVRLEVLDWGGSGRALVLLAGSGNTAHVFDDFAPKLTSCCHVYGITRRGYGASSRPASGYANQRLADDILQVITSLRLDAPILIGHSMAGGEMTTIAHQHSGRLGGLIYLDALGDPRDWPASDPNWMALMKKLPPPRPSPPCPQNRTSFAAYRSAQQCSAKFAFPESELRQLYEAGPDGSVGEYHGSTRGIHEAIGEGEVKRDYSNIRVPVLALFEFPRSIASVTHSDGTLDVTKLRPDDPYPRNDEDAANMLAFASATKAFMDRWVTNLTRSVPDAKLVDLPGAGHYVFLTRESRVVEEILTFVRTLQLHRRI